MAALKLLSLFVLLSVSWTGTYASYILPENARPILYMIHLKPDIMQHKFSGKAIIDFIVETTSAVLVMNQKYLSIQNIVLDGIVMKYWSTDNDMETLVVYCKSDLIKNHTYRIQIEYNGTMSKTRHGFYISRYTSGNKMKWIATTHFEPTSARLAFPCWDEPIYKASFEISITHLKNYTAVTSNMPVANKTDNGPTVTTQFVRSLPMCTYLVAFVVSDYNYLNHSDNQFKIYTKPESVNQTEYAWNFSVKAMKELDNFTEIPYFSLMPKMDQISIMDFSSGAMENWGLVTYRETHLLWEESVTMSTDKETIATTISHEFAHQWFGNLVTPKWWDNLWLNEGFATYFQYYVTEKVEPTWRMMDLFPIDIMQWGAFISDGKMIARPMIKSVTSPTEISNLFDSITYQKAGAIIRMFSHVLGKEVFRSALKNYLHKNSFNVTDHNDLISEFQAAAGKDMLWGGVSLGEIFEGWLWLAGYPVVTVKKDNSGSYTLTQERFLYYGTNKKSKWWIPITYVTNNNMNFTDTKVTQWMSPYLRNLTITETKSDWILVNKQQTGYYRVNYDDETWQKLSHYLKTNKHHIHPVNRAQLIDDVLTMALKNLTKYETALSLTLYLNHEIDYIPWVTFFNSLKYLHNLMVPSKQYHIFKHYLRFILHGLTTNVTFKASPKDAQPTKILRSRLMKWACLAGVKECIDHAHKEFNAWLDDSKHRLDPDLKKTILCTGLKTASETVWNRVLKRLTEKYDKTEETNLIAVMGCSNNRKILDKFLKTFTKRDLSLQLGLAVKAVVNNANVSGTEIVMGLLTELANTPNSKHKMSFVLTILADGIMDEKTFLKLIRFVVEVESPEEDVLNLVIQSTRNIKWITTHRKIIDDWLVENEKLFHNSSGTLMFASFLLIFSVFLTGYY